MRQVPRQHLALGRRIVLRMTNILSALLQVCHNPKQPDSHHYWFESVAALIQHSAATLIGVFTRYQSPPSLMAIMYVPGATAAAKQNPAL